MEKVVVIVGPTASGKTKLSIELAKACNGEIISGDSMQIYKKMDIGTAKIMPNEMEGIIHHQIDIRDPFDNYSVSHYQQDVRKCIDKIIDKGKLPIIVGGTGLYIKAVLYDYVFEETESKHHDYDKYTNDELYEKLVQVDKISAEKIHKNNRQRLIRALSIYEQTGQTKSNIEAKQNHQMIYDAKVFCLNIDRKQLIDRINQRVEIMFEQGLEKELGLTKENQSMKAIGYKEWFEYQDLDEIKEKIKIHTRQYAKRQYTWFKNQMEVIWIDVNNEMHKQVIKEVKQWIQS